MNIKYHLGIFLFFYKILLKSHFSTNPQAQMDFAGSQTDLKVVPGSAFGLIDPLGPFDIFIDSHIQEGELSQTHNQTKPENSL